MQVAKAGLLFIPLLLLSSISTLAVATGAGGRGTEPPITRVVNLMKSLIAKIELEGKTEQDLYETYICWGKKLISTKTASNEAAQSRIDSLEQYVADLDSGAIELTTERVDLEKEIKEVSENIEAATNKREQEKKDYEMAKAELEQGIAALTSAIEVLGNATVNSTTGVLLGMKARVNEGMMSFQEREAQGATLDRGLAIADKFLSKGDALFLRRVLTGDVPVVDWKKLNRKATFKMKYKARSFNIQTTLRKLLSTFTGNLNDATDKENKAQADFDKIKAAMDEQLKSTQEAYTKMEKEAGAKAEAKASSNEEIDALKDQIDSDSETIKNTKAAMEAKKAEWKERKAIRAGEIKALNEAIEILFNDDSRDLFKKSFESQGYSFLQTGTRGALMSKAMQTIAKAGRIARDDRLLTFAVQNDPQTAAEVTDFTKVLSAIDTMVEHLRKEEDEDLKIKEECEKTRMKDARDAILYSRSMDEMTDDITRLTSEIEELKATIEALVAKMKKDKEEMDEATKIRGEENVAWQATDKDDTEAAALVTKAKEVISKYYDSVKKSALLQKKAVQAPPPTWTESYDGSQGAAQGVTSILQLIIEDIEKDQKKAKAEEDEAQAAYDKAFEAYKTQMAADQAEKIRLEGEVGTKETAKTDKIKERKTKFDELEIVYKQIEDQEKQCNYYTINYPVRRDNRLLEIDGLLKAKSILSGGRFTKPKDPTREIKPGDAFLQRVKSHQ